MKLVEVWYGYIFDFEINNSFALDQKLYEAQVGLIQLKMQFKT